MNLARVSGYCRPWRNIVDDDGACANAGTVTDNECASRCTHNECVSANEYVISNTHTMLHLAARQIIRCKSHMLPYMTPISNHCGRMDYNTKTLMAKP